jgi:hypothetical protein
MSVLLIGEREEKAIAKALELARDAYLPWSIGERIMVPPTAELTLKDRKHDNPFPRSQHLMLGTYQCAISFEEQPAGLVRHLSVSVRRHGKVPTPLAMKMIAEAFGFEFEPGDEFHLTNGRSWLEEFEPGHHAVNVIQLESAS